MNRLSLFRVIAMLLLTAISVSCFAGCAGGKTPDQVFVPPEFDEDKVSFYGYELMYNHAPDTGIPLGSPFGYLENTTFADLSLNRVNDIEKQYDCDIQFSWSTTSEMKSGMTASAASGARYCDITDVEDGITKDMALAGALLPYSEVSEYIDIYDFNKWGAPNIYECVMHKGELYGLRSNLWPNRYPSFGAPIIFSEPLVADGGYADPREFVENKTWNRELMLQMIKDCTVTENGETKIYGMSVDTSYIFTLCITKKGESIFKEENGVIVNNTTADDSVSAMTWVRDMLLENPECFVNDGVYVDRDTFMNPFLEGRAAMFMHMTWALFSIVGMQVESWGLLPYPTGIEKEYGDWAAYYAGNRNYVGIAVNMDEPETAAFVIDKLYEPLETLETPELMKQYYVDNMFYDERDYDLYFEMCRNCRYMYHNNGGYDLTETLAKGFKRMTVAEAVQSRAASVDRLIEEYVTENQASYKELLSKYISVS